MVRTTTDKPSTSARHPSSRVMRYAGLYGNIQKCRIKSLHGNKALRTDISDTFGSIVADSSLAKSKDQLLGGVAISEMRQAREQASALLDYDPIKDKLHSEISRLGKRSLTYVALTVYALHTSSKCSISDTFAKKRMTRF